MVKQLFAALAALFLAAAAHAAIDVNKATQAELEAVKGIGPSLSTAIVGERRKGEFKDWGDFAGRVKGVGDRSATKFSDNGLTVRGQAYAGQASAAKPAKNGRAGATGSKSAGETPRRTRASAAAASAPRR